MSAGPGRIVADVAVEAPLPRPMGFRTTEVFRATVETVSTALARGMERAA
jgi:NitT/TauT family transport system ATP-binding protein